MAAIHNNSAAFRLYQADGARTSSCFVDDGEHGMGRAMRNKLQELGARNVAVFVTRVYGGKHIGPKRFSVVKDLIKRVVEKLS